MCNEKRKQLEEIIRNYTKEDTCIAFSGGIDSSLILKLATRFAKEEGTRVYAATFVTKLHPAADLEIAKRVSSECGAEFVKIEVDETQIQEIQNNPVDRCYYCKRYLFKTLIEWAKDKNITTIIEGTNADDLKVYRPGLKAVRELKVHSPLQEAGFSKADIRAFAEDLSISVAKRPSAPCMATRLPYGERLDFEALEKLDQGEEYMRKLGFSIVRLRLHNDIVRIEINPEQFENFMKKREEIVSYLKQLGFWYITLDMEGFRSGSMDYKLTGKDQ